jgi:hypothetical protein
VDEQLAENCAEAAVRGARPLSRNGYKIHMVKTAVKRAVHGSCQYLKGNSVMSENTSDKIVQIPCRHLRSKEMFHQEIGESDDHECASGLYWCGRSQESFGPRW